MNTRRELRLKHNIASAIEDYLENALFSDERNDISDEEIQDMIDEFKKYEDDQESVERYQKALKEGC